MDALPTPLPAAETVTVEPASFWVRGGAAIFDSLLLSTLTVLKLGGVSAAGALLYKTLFVARAGGQTPGKMIAGIRVIRADGDPVLWPRALGRAAGEYVSTIVGGLGYVIAAFGEKRALHDFIAGTRVINVEGTPPWRRRVMAGLGLLAPLLILAGLSMFLGGPPFFSRR